MIRIIDIGNAQAIAALLERGARGNRRVERRVAEIVARVRRDGDRAVLTYARRFDGLTGGVEVSHEEMREAAASLAGPVRGAIRRVARAIRHVARRQMPRRFTTQPVSGVSVEQRVIPLDRVGCYVPGGRFPLPSSLLMTAVPAQVAHVGEIVAVCPRPDAAVMAAAIEAGVSRLLRIGGAHAIAALAFGTETVPKVDKIVGPGNAYVAAAKTAVARECAIDFFAGPTEIVIVSASGRPAWIAADLLAQAEHDPEARAILATPNRALANAVAAEIRRQVPRHSIASTAIDANGGIVLTRTIEEAIDLSERIAPEHVVCDSEAMASRLKRAGTVFVGRYSAQASGDYATGSNHVLPTSGVAAARGGLSAADFVRVATVQRLTRAGLVNIAADVIALANAEGLRAHAASVALRMSGASR